MGLASTLFSVLAAPLLSAVDARVRQRIAEALANLDRADPSDVADLARRVEAAQRSLSDLRAEVGACRTAIDGLGPAAGDADEAAMLRVIGLEARDAELTHRLDALQEGLSRLGTDVVSLKDAIGGAEAHLTKVESVAAKAGGTAKAVGGAVLAPAPGCKVPGCTGSHRARGYCARHYQMWKRGTLDAA